MIFTPTFRFTVNVDIFAFIHFREIMKMCYFACIKIHVLSLTGSGWYYKRNFRGVHIFVDIKETQIKQKYVQHKNIYIHSIQCQLSFNKTESLISYFYQVIYEPTREIQQMKQRTSFYGL